MRPRRPLHLVAKQARAFVALFLPAAMLSSPWAAAESSSAADERYRMLIVLHFSDDAAFTPTFVRSVHRQVRDLTRNLFGPLAEIEVSDRHPLLDQSPNGALAELSLTPAEFRTALVDGNQTFDKAFLFEIDFRSGQYLIAWRQLDGEVQQIMALRERRTPNRQWVGKAVALAVNDDFAPVARVIPTVDRDKVQLEFRGGHLGSGDLLAPWLGEGSILQPFWIVQQGDGSLARMALPYTALQIEKEGGYKWARVMTNLANPWLQSPRVVGFQAWKLHTQTGRFRLRLLDEATGAPLQNCSVYAGSRGFADLSDADRLPDPDAQGCVVSSRPFADLAYIRISQGGGQGIQFPLPITSDWCEATCRAPLDAAASEKSDLERQTSYLVDDVKALQTGLSDRVREVNQLNADKRYEEALRAARGAVVYGAKYRESLPKRLRDLEARWQSMKSAPGPSLAWLEKQSDELERQRQGLETLAENLDHLIQRNDAQSRANVLIELGNQAVRDGDVDEAIEKYTLALGEQPEQPALQKRLQRLKADWRIKSPEHRRARDFVYATWDKTELTGLDGALPQAEQALTELQKAGDYLAAGKMLKINERLVGDCNHVVQQLAGQDGEADQKEHEKYVGLLEQLAKLQQRTADFCASAAAAQAAAPAPVGPRNDAAGQGRPADRPPEASAPGKPATRAANGEREQPPPDKTSPGRR